MLALRHLKTHESVVDQLHPSASAFGQTGGSTNDSLTSNSPLTSSGLLRVRYHPTHSSIERWVLGHPQLAPNHPILPAPYPAQFSPVTRFSAAPHKESDPPISPPSLRSVPIPSPPYAPYSCLTSFLPTLRYGRLPASFVPRVARCPMARVLIPSDMITRLSSLAERAVVRSPAQPSLPSPLLYV